MQILSPGKLDHFVCVVGRRWLVWDNEECLPVELNCDLLCLCRGMKLKKVKALSMEMVKQLNKNLSRKLKF